LKDAVNFMFIIPGPVVPLRMPLSVFQVRLDDSVVNHSWGYIIVIANIAHRIHFIHKVLPLVSVVKPKAVDHAIDMVTPFGHVTSNRTILKKWDCESPLNAYKEANAVNVAFKELGSVKKNNLALIEDGKANRLTLWDLKIIAGVVGMD
jgi:hypothetical protein